TQNCDHIKRQHPGIRQLMLYLAEACAGIFHQTNSGKPQAVDVLEHVGERNDSCPTLGRVKPVSFPRIRNDVRLASIPDKDSGERVIEDWEVNKSPFQERYEGKGIQKLDLGGIGVRPVCGVGVRDKMLNEKSADRHDAAERMQTAKQE